MANDFTKCLNMEGQDNTHDEANQQPTFAPLQTTDPQAAALAQAYSQFTIMLKRLLENPQPSGELIPPTRIYQSSKPSDDLLNYDVPSNQFGGSNV
ncbi:hypothetical protein JCGZ_22785 [Jatropha curcas]|uniref:Uncharacterized protein n=1 Tax=Jatropha curcas TaxID=180498 RepID=A0A067L7R0_JATCU|nr:hypothetical protein JCGZ_22785 [Jatropha curcas]